MRSRKKVFFSGEVTSVTSTNEKGEFDILLHHTRFITLIKDFVLVDKGLATEQKIELDSGVLSVIDNQVDVYVGVGV